MKSINKIFAAAAIAFAVVFVAVNLYLMGVQSPESKLYLVEIKRLSEEIEAGGFSPESVDKYAAVSAVTMLSSTDEESFFAGGGLPYEIRRIGGEYYRFDYINNDNGAFKSAVAGANIALGALAAITAAVLVYLKIKLIKPFHSLSDVPYELSRGNLAVPLKENKSRFFGRFVWGMDLLRENLEEQKSRELRLYKEKKTLILSISHDIKTPLSAIKLYSKALQKNLYEGKEKQLEIAANIGRNADEIESFVSQIINASREDFLDFTVNNSEFYLAALVEKISGYYAEKLMLIKTEFIVGEYDNCLLKGDFDRAAEVVQNVIENAVKYGDGGKISLSFSREEGCVLVKIENSGNSLAESETAHIFESFWRGSNVGNQSGNGLGLYICRRLMAKMNGDIFAETDGESIAVTAVFEMA